MYNLENTFLLVASLINLFMAVFVLSRGWKNKINLYFAALTFFNFTWALGLLLSIIYTKENLSEFFYRSAYVSALGIAMSLFYFTLNYHYNIFNLKKYHKFFMWFLTGAFSFLAFTRYHIVEFYRFGEIKEWMINYNSVYYILYSIYFIIIVLFSIYFLYRKHKNMEGIIREQVGFLMGTIIVGLFFGAYFNLFLCFFGNWDYIWLGPIFTLFMNATVFYLIKSAKE